MHRLYQPLLFLLARSTADDLQRQVEYLKAENELLRKRVPRKRIFLKSDERAKLLKLGKGLGPAIRHLITIVDYSTFRRWVREENPAAVKRRKGRPRITQMIRDVILQIANETGWGYSRILGELRKLGLGRISRQSVKNILVEHGFDPGPKRGRGSWSQFLKIHADTLWQIDFFSKRVWTRRGPRQVLRIGFHTCWHAARIRHTGHISAEFCLDESAGAGVRGACRARKTTVQNHHPRSRRQVLVRSRSGIHAAWHRRQAGRPASRI